MPGTIVRAKSHPRFMAYILRYRDEYLAPIPEEERGDLIAAYHKRLTSQDEKVRIETAKAWAKWVYVMKRVYTSCD